MSITSTSGWKPFGLLQDFCWPKPPPHGNLVVGVKFSDSPVKPICLVSFFAVVFSVDGSLSPPWTWSVLVELQRHCVCHHKPTMVKKLGLVWSKSYILQWEHCKKIRSAKPRSKRQSQPLFLAKENSYSHGNWNGKTTDFFSKNKDKWKYNSPEFK